MNKTLNIMPKDEAFSYDELSLLSEITGFEKTAVLAAALEARKDTSAVFFMPQSTFDIFSMFQGTGSLCQISGSDVEKIISLLNEKRSCINQNLFSHFSKKLNVLSDFLKNGNNVQPVVIQSDSFSVLNAD